MTLFDISVLIFFLLTGIKAIHDTMLFWAEADNTVAVRRQVISAPVHRPAPARPAPSFVRPAAAERAVATSIRSVSVRNRSVA